MRLRSKLERLDVRRVLSEHVLDDVLSDVAGRTPGRYVHVGGDEVLTMEAGEYALLVRTAADAVERAGRTVVVWQEGAKAPLTPGEQEAVITATV